jgi:signal transduction histidine kinase
MARAIAWPMPMPIEGGLKRRINRTFLLQAAAISLAAVVSVYLAATVIKHVLVTEALRLEAEYFWQRRAGDPAFALPDTRNLTGLLSRVGGEGQLPEGLRDLGDGFHEVPSGAGLTTVYVSTRDDQRLYLVFDGERVNELAAYFGLLPLIVVLVVLYLSVWLAYRASHRAVSPVTWLAREVNRLDPDAPNAEPFAAQQLPVDADEEVRVLAAALAGLAKRLDAYVERERNFTRDASHELRTPLTVLRVAADTLMERDDLPAPARQTVQRIKRSTRDMEDLVEAFLLLAREGETGLGVTRVCINDVVDAELEQLKLISADKPLQVSLRSDCRLWVRGPDQALSSMIGNLLRNAFSYTDAGLISVHIGPNHVVIEDSGVGMDAQGVEQAFEPFFRGQPSRRGGHGVGLTIVRRFSDRFHWPISIDSKPGVGTRVRVEFPDAECQTA